MKIFKTLKLLIAVVSIIIFLQSCVVTNSPISQKSGYLNITNTSKNTKTDGTAAGPAKTN